MRALAVLIVSLVLAAPAAAGGWATAGLGPPDGGIGSGDTWNAEITLLQHGQTPLVGVIPAVIIRSDKGVEKRFTAKPTDRAGVYLAKVKFPSSGTWQYFVYDGFGQYGGAQTHSFAPVQIGPGGGGGSALPVWPFVAGGMLIALAVALFFARRLRPVAAPAAQQ